MSLAHRARRLLAVVALALAATAPASAATHGSAAGPKPNPNTGIVDIYTKLGFQNSQAAGTGMIVTPSGEVLTNNHVIRGATSFRLVEVASKRTYAATVVGYSVPEDVAVLQIADAHGLKTVRLGNSANLKLRQAVVARGNAGGRGGATVARGLITALHRQIVASDGEGGSETLSNLIETDAGIEAGDSGGPLFNAAGRAIGMITAGSALQFRNVASRGYAIRINRALTIKRQIEAGVSNETVHVGPTAFLGITIEDAQGGVRVRGVLGGTAAEAAGLAAGDLITSLNGTTVATGDDLRTVVLALVPGATVAVAWTDGTGVARSGQITPAEGPPQ